MDSFEISVDLPAAPEGIYRMWLGSEGHAALIDGSAEVQGGVGGTFSIWDGYITGRTLELEPPRRIVQAWRTTEFPEGAPDSRLVVRLEAASGGTRLTLVHTEIPDGQGSRYEDGWKENYFEPMKAYFLKV